MRSLDLALLRAVSSLSLSQPDARLPQASTSDVDASEDALWNQLDNSHDGLPEPRHEDHLRAALPCAVDAVGGGFWSDRQRTFSSPGHAGVHRAELHCHNMNSGTGHPSPQPLQERSERRLRRSLHVVLLPSAFSGDGANRDDEAALLLFEVSLGK